MEFANLIQNLYRSSIWCNSGPPDSAMWNSSRLLHVHCRCQLLFVPWLTMHHTCTCVQFLKFVLSMIYECPWYSVGYFITHENLDHNQLRPACCIIAIVQVYVSIFHRKCDSKTDTSFKEPSQSHDGTALGEYAWGRTPEVARNLIKMLLFRT